MVVAGKRSCSRVVIVTADALKMREGVYDPYPWVGFNLLNVVYMITCYDMIMMCVSSCPDVSLYIVRVEGDSDDRVSKARLAIDFGAVHVNLL